MSNNDQADADDDGVGDACTCPCDPDNDKDGDKICGPSCTPGSSHCPSRCVTSAVAKVDNCPAVWNFAQKNCNEFSEITLKKAVLGDECDPVPCPLSSADVVTNGTADQCKGDTRVGFFCEGRRRHDLVHTDTIGSRERNRACSDTACEGQGSYVSGFTTTWMRFCQQGIDSGQRPVDCHGPAVIRNAQVNRFPSADLEPADARTPWHRVSVDGLLVPENRDGSYLWNYGAGPGDPTQGTDRRWDYKNDEQFWLKPPSKIPDYSTLEPDYFQGCSRTRGAFGSLVGTCLNGTFWTHAETEIGATLSSFQDLFGNRRVVGIHDVDLSNHFFDIQPDQVYSYQQKGSGILSDRPFFLWQTLPDPYWSERIRRSAVVLPGPQDRAASAYSLQADGRGIEVTSTLSPAIVQLLSSDGVFVASAVEPAPYLGRLRADVIGAFVTADGTAAAAFRASGVISRGGGGVGGLSGAARQASLATAVSSGAIPPRSNPIAVFSRSAGGLFVLGGQDTSGVPMHDLWFQPVREADGDELGAVELGELSLGEVLAATFAYGDQHLWVLDEAPNAHTLRLSRIDPTRATAETVARWPHRREHCRRLTGARYSLVVAMGGAPILTISKGERNTVLALKLGKHGVSASSVDVVSGNLDMPPIVDERGVSYVFKLNDGSLRIERRLTPPKRFDDDRDRDDRTWMAEQLDPR